MKNDILRLFLSGLILSTGTVSVANAQKHINELPLEINSSNQFYSNTQNGSAAIDWKATNQITTLKTTNWTQTGTATMVIAFNDIPGLLKINASAVSGATCTSGNHNDLTISISSDNSNYTTLSSLSSDKSHDVAYTIAPTTRYIKFHFNVKANGFLSGSYCGHEFDPVTFSLPKSIDIVEPEISLQGKIGETLKDTISVNYSNLQGNLSFECSNPSFSIRRITELNNEVEGTYNYEISISTEQAEEINSSLKIYDEGYPEAFETLSLYANIISDAAPEAPNTITSENISYGGFNVAWNAVDKSVSYIVLLYNESEELINEYPVKTNKHEFSALQAGATYKIGIKSVSESNQISSISELITVTTKTVEKPSNLSYKAQKQNISFTWDSSAEVEKYKLSLFENDAVLEEVELPTTLTAYTFKNLTKGNAYSFSIHSIIGSHHSEKIKMDVSTPVDFGSQLMNSDFEKWEAVSVGREPLNWNSFANVTGGASNMAKGEQVRSSDSRPQSTGKLSANIFSKQILMFYANGNLTTGQINANSTTATSLSNFNAIVRENSDFHQIIEEKPDSVSIWVKNVPQTATAGKDSARLSFILHGDGIVNDPSSTVSSLVTSIAELNFAPCDWVRVTFPFKEINNVDPKYLLVSITTNKTPGIATGKQDNVYVDDLVLIYKPTLAVEPLATTSYTEGDTFELPYTLTGSMSVSNIDAATNTVYAELSDNTGSFDNATIVSEAITTDESGVLQVKLPNKMTSGNKYRIRVVTTNYPMNSEADQNLAIEGSDVPNSLEQVTKINCKLYPNPAKERFFLSNAEGAVYHIRNIANQTVMSATYTSAGIDVTNLTTGIYFINIRMGSDIQQLKFIKE